MKDLKFYTIIAGIFFLILLIILNIVYIIKSERKIKELEEKNIKLEITRQTLEKNIKEQQKIIKNIYEKQQQNKKLIKQKADKMKISDLSKPDEKIKKEIESFNML